jgi:phosphoglycolate phosphatase
MADNKAIKLLVTDLDNTLYDWLSSFVPAFYKMIEVAVEILQVDREQLLDEMKAVHQQYHNSEQPFALLETPTVERKYPRATRLERKGYLNEAFREFSIVRKHNLRLYPGVRETLHKIRETGCTVVGHTEAVVENSLYRLELLKLTDELQCLYAPRSRAQGHPDPTRPRIHELYEEFVYLLPSDHRKPDPAVLKDICSRHKVALEDTLYVGDSIPRDVAMAKLAGACAAWARYGTQRNQTMWDKLVRVTHWTDADVVREKRLREEYQDVDPDVEIDAFPELLKCFEFEGNSERRETKVSAY